MVNPTILCAAHTVQWARGDGDDLLPLQPLNLSGPSNVVVRAVAQPVIVPFPPRNNRYIHNWAMSPLTTTVTHLLCTVLYVPRVHSPRLSESHRKLRAALHFDHAEAGERVNLRARNRFIGHLIDKLWKTHQISSIMSFIPPQSTDSVPKWAPKQLPDRNVNEFMCWSVSLLFEMIFMDKHGDT